MASRLVLDGAVALQLEDTHRTYHVGRMESADLPINDPSVSRRHCTLAHDPAADVWQLTDLDSAQGTTVDGARLAPHAPCALKRGARVQLGQLVRVYVFDCPLPPPPPPPPAAAPAEPSAPSARPAPAGPAVGASVAAQTCVEAEPPPDLTGVSERKTGTAVKWDVLKGWGFVKPDDGGADVFAHRNDLKFEPAAAGGIATATVRSLRPGEHVVFRLAYKDGRPQAVEITGPDGASVLGQPPPPPPADDDAAAAAAAGGRGGRGGRGRGRGLSFFSVELPSQTPAPGPDRTERARVASAPVGFVPRQARKAAATAPHGAVGARPAAVGAAGERAGAENQ